MKIEYENGEVIVRIPVDEASSKLAPMSASGKSRMIASTGGFVPVQGAPAGVRLNLNLIGKP